MVVGRAENENIDLRLSIYHKNKYLGVTILRDDTHGKEIVVQLLK